MRISVCDVPNLPISQFFDFIRYAPINDVRAFWVRYGPDKPSKRGPSGSLRQRPPWTIPLTLAGVDVYALILLRINAAEYREPPMDVHGAHELPGPHRVPEYERRRALAVKDLSASETAQAAARANGFLGLGVFAKDKDYTLTDPRIAVPLVVECEENGHAVAAAEVVEKDARRELPWTVAVGLADWRRDVKPRLWPEVCA